MGQLLTSIKSSINWSKSVYFGQFTLDYNLPPFDHFVIHKYQINNFLIKVNFGSNRFYKSGWNKAV